MPTPFDDVRLLFGQRVFTPLFRSSAFSVWPSNRLAFLGKIVALVARIGLSALCVSMVGCIELVSIPPASADKPPVVTVTSFASGPGSTDPENTSVTGTVNVMWGMYQVTTVLVGMNAENPGGVESGGSSNVI